MAEFDDLTARARIRQAAMAQFADLGFERTTVRSIAAAAGVSPGLVRHHFGSKQGLRDAVDAYVMEELRRFNQQAMAESERGDLGPAAIRRQEMQPLQHYLVRALTEGSTTLATVFDQAVEMTQRWIDKADETRMDPPYIDGRTRAAVYTAMVFGVPLLRDQLSRVLDVDILSADGWRRLALALLDIYSHPIVTPELAASARDGLDTDSRMGSHR